MASPDSPSQNHDNFSLQKATFAGGCFWCMELAFEHVDGVTQAISGYTGGHKKNPTYGEVVAKTTGHREAVEVTYDPDMVSYEELLETYWKSIDPLDKKGQFADKGFQYTSAIYYHNDEQKKLAETSKQAKSKMLGQEVVTEIIEASTFYLAEDYHQDYGKKNPGRYKMYYNRSGRPGRLKEVWGKQ